MNATLQIPQLYEMNEAIQTLTAEVQQLRRTVEAVQMQPEPEWVSVRRAAEIYERHPDTVHRWIRGGEIESKIVGKRRMVKVK